MIRAADQTEHLMSDDPGLVLWVGFRWGPDRLGGAEVMDGKMLMIGVTTLKPCSFTVDKNNSKASFCQQKPQQQPSQPTQSFRSKNAVKASVPQDERKDPNIQQIKLLLQESNRRFEAVAIVLQQILTEVRQIFICRIYL